MLSVSFASIALLSAAVVLAEDLSTITASPATPTLNRRQSNTAVTTYETTSPLPLTDYFYPYTDLPSKVNPYPVGRGPQSGYNQCNSTTQGPDSQCQTLEMNSLFDFCLWGAPGLYPNQSVGDVEAATVAYCSIDGHGGRIFPPGTFTAIQFMRTPAYIQIVGLFNQTSVGLTNTDPGGELDPHGADGLGNPLGGLVYSTGFSSGDNHTYIQTESWNMFLDTNKFCLKLCDPNYQTESNYCQNIFDLIGCDYNAPAAYEEGVFLSCDGDIQSEVGTYTNSNGQTLTWSQPPSLSPGYTLPYTPSIPASSNCVTYQSTDLFPIASLGYQSTNNVFGALGPTTAATASGSSATAGSTGTSEKSKGASGSSKTGSAASSASASSTKTGAAARLVPGSLAFVTLGGVLVALL